MALHSVCLFCCKSFNDANSCVEPSNYEGTISPEEIARREKHFLTTKKLHVLLKRYCFGGTEVPVSLEELSHIWPDKGVGFCVHCGGLVERMCAEYHCLKVMELRLSWKLESLRNIVQVADKLKERRQLLKTTIEENWGGEEGEDDSGNAEEQKRSNDWRKKEVYRRVKLFRKALMEKHYVANSLPRVKLDRNSVKQPNKNLSPSVPCSEAIIEVNTTSEVEENTLGCITNLGEENLSHTVTEASSSKHEQNEEVPNAESISVKDEQIQVNLYLSANEKVYICDEHTDHSDLIEDGLPSPVSCVAEQEREKEPFEYQEESPDPLQEVSDNSAVPLPNEVEQHFQNVTEPDRSQNHEVVNAEDPSTHPETGISAKSELIGSEENTSGPNADENASTSYCLRRSARNITRKSYTAQEDSEDDNEDNEDDDTTYQANLMEENNVVNPNNDFNDTDLSHNDLKVETAAYAGDILNANYQPKSDSNIRLPKKRGRKPGSNDKGNKKKKPIKSEYSCVIGNCNTIFQTEQEHEYHKQLHGSFPCNFCPTVESFAPDLCCHELQHYNSPEKEDKKPDRCYACPRCPYRINVAKNSYIEHHLKAHLNIRCQFDKWQCPICAFVTKKSAKNIHVTSNHDVSGMDPSEVVRCKEINCSAYFVTRIQLVSHLYQIHQKDYTKLPNESVEDNSNESNPFFPCKQCGKRFKVEAWLRQHEMLYHSHIRSKRTRSKKWIKCKVAKCTEKFFSKQALEMHKKLHSTFKCNFCSVEKDYAPDLAMHEAIEHKQIKNITFEPEPANPSTSKKLKPPRIQCPRCDCKTKYSKLYYLQHHLEKHLNLAMNSVVCDICGATLKDTNGSHFNVQHNTEGMTPEEIHKCDKCPAYFRLGIQLVRHQRMKHFLHKDGFKCEICGGQYKTGRSLFSHVRIYHSSKDTSNDKTLPEVCDEPKCGMRFATKAEKEWHSTWNHVKHEKLSGLIKCKICDRPCKGEKALRSHMHNAHSGRKSKPKHVCDQCGKQFQFKAKLDAHKIWHQDPSTWESKCEICSKMCFDKHKLAEHMRVHSNEKPFQCEVCGDKYAHRHNWRLHMKNKHGIDIPRPPPGGKGSQIRERVVSSK